MLTRQHYELFALAVAKVENLDEREKTCQFLADVFIKDNPRFNRGKFTIACFPDLVKSHNSYHHGNLFHVNCPLCKAESIP